VKVLVVIPTYQEALNVVEILPRVRAAVPDADILVADDNSPDGTAKLAEELNSELGQISVLHRPGRAGLGRAYIDAWTSVLDDYDLIISMDADGSHDPAAIPTLITLAGDADLVLGSRYVPGGSTPSWSPYRRWLSVGGSRYSSWLLHLGVRDVTGGFRAYRTSLLARLDLPTIKADGYGFQVEMLYRAKIVGATVVETPITFEDRTLGTSKMTFGIVLEALKLVTWWGIKDRVRGGRHGTG
jgi:dolichol-phosphate mannosyltransferase